jgi:hypothetical protein
MLTQPSASLLQLPPLLHQLLAAALQLHAQQQLRYPCDVLEYARQRLLHPVGSCCWCCVLAFQLFDHRSFLLLLLHPLYP